ncbi:TonB C-terminal domain-containing protein [Sulfurospirillum sp. 1612]|uniref:TonB C-terminal domain-containing protein n=1 Tax=Sulfurospirillum sp. 1612 TaxID=3094835 RepID=UPI002F944FBB
MLPKSRYNVVGFSLSILLYICIVVSLGFYLQSRIKNNINYVVSNKNVLDITLVQNKTKKRQTPPKKVPKKTKVKPKSAPKPSPKNVTAKHEKKVALRGLFDKIDVKKIEKPHKKKAVATRKMPTNKKSANTAVKKNDAKKLVDALTFEKQSNIKSVKNGVVDKFRGTVTQILDTNWQNTIDTVSGNKATVMISIDNLGNFSYKIEKLSYNDEFNAKLLDFLEEMKDKEFPPYTEGGIFKLPVIFKDIRNE